MAKRRGHGEGSIYQRASDGLWVGSLNLGWVDGKRKRKYVYGKTQAEVREQLAQFTNDRDRGLTVPTERMTVEDFLERWLHDSVEGRGAPGTVTAYTTVVRRHIVPVLGRKPLAKLTAQDVHALIRDRERTGLSARTVRQILVIFRMALKQAVLWDLIPRNVATLVSPPKSRPFEATALDAEQITRFLDKSQTHRLHALFALAVMLGPRHGELLGLKWSDVDCDTAQIHIRRSLTRVGKGFELHEPKTASSKRTIAIPPSIVVAMREHRSHQLQERLRAGGRWVANDLVFCSGIGTPLDDRLLRREFRAVLESADLPLIRFHDLRHTAITAMIQQGVPPHVVAKIVGHTTITMTLGTYAKVVGTTMRDAANVLEAAYGGATAANKVSS